MPANGARLPGLPAETGAIERKPDGSPGKMFKKYPGRRVRAGVMISHVTENTAGGGLFVFVERMGEHRNR